MHISSIFTFLSPVTCALSLVTQRDDSKYVPTSEEWDQAEQKATQFVASLNLTEKVTLVTGSLTEGASVGCIGIVRPIERVGFPGLCLLDGPNAVNRAHLVSVFPSGMTAAASWDRDMLYQRGVALGREFKAKGGHVILGPTTGPIGRHPAGGRNWEAFSPDPYLSGEAIKYTVMGHQSVGVQTSSKHFIGNEQETQRSNTVHEDGSVTEGISSNIDDRTLHELYLWPFADAIKAGTASIMCSYNRLNQTYACENPHLLKDILRKELGFRGYVVSDWFATHSTSEAANAGLDMEQPGEVPAGASGGYGGGGYFGSKLEKAVQAGNVTEKRINTMVRNLMTPYFLLHQDTPNYPPADPSLPFLLGITNIGWDSPYLDVLGPPQPGLDVRGNHHELIRKMGASATVLLKNENTTLPLKFNGKEGIRNIGVFGNAAIDPTEGVVVLPSEDDIGPEYGPLAIGGGAGSGRNSYLISPLEAIRTRARKSGAMVQHLASNDVIASNDFRSIYPKPDICVVFLKSYAEETFDRPSLELSWNSTLVVKNVAKFCGAGKTVVVTNSAGVNVLPWAGNSNVTAILATHYPGQEIGNSIADVLWGDTEPSGRLPYTIPKTEEDYGFPIVNLTGSDGKPEKDSSKWQANFTEGTLIDYRHFDFNDIDPQFEFGFGLGYTTFELGPEAKVVQLGIGAVSEFPNPRSKIEPGGNPELWTDLFSVLVRVKNTGARKGSTTVQLYLSLPEVEGGQDVPVRVLRGFEKVELRKHETRQVEFKLRRRDLSYWDVTKQQWRIPRGEFKLSIGFSSRNLPVTQEVHIS